MVRRIYTESVLLWRGVMGERLRTKEEELAKIKTLVPWKKRYEIYMLSQAWSEKRRRVLERDNYQCKACGSKKYLQVDHLTYARLCDEWLEDLQTLCLLCHAEKTKRFDMRSDATYRGIANRRVLLQKRNLFEVDK